MAKETKKRNHKKDRSSSDDCQAEFGLGKREISLAKTKTSQNNPKLSVVYWWLIRLIKKVRTPTVGGWYPHPHSPGGVPYVLANHDLASRLCCALLRHLYRAHFEDSWVLVEMANSLLSIIILLLVDVRSSAARAFKSVHCAHMHWPVCVIPSKTGRCF